MRSLVHFLVVMSFVSVSLVYADERQACTRPAASQPTSTPADSEFKELFNGKDLTGWRCKKGSWAVEDGLLVRKGAGDIWALDQYGDFVLDLEVKFQEDANSGIFFRVADTADAVQTGIECQIMDSHGKNALSRNGMGAIYDCVAPSKDMTKPAGQWNRVILTCDDNIIKVVLNGEQIIDMDLNKWVEPRQNPDGSRNKFNTAYKELKRIGSLGLQDHGTSVWFRHIRIKPIVHADKPAERK